jgi:CxxC motif-containing protein
MNRGCKKLYDKLGVVSSKATNGFGVFESEGKKLQVDKPCKVGDIVLRSKKGGKAFVLSADEWKALPDNEEKQGVNPSKTEKPTPKTKAEEPLNLL